MATLGTATAVKPGSYRQIPAGTYDVVAVAFAGSDIMYAATLTTGVAAGTSVGTIDLVAAPHGASITGMVTSSSGSAAVPVDVTLSALQSANSSLQFTIPLVEQWEGTDSLPTAAGTDCPANTACVGYLLRVPDAGPDVGAFSASGTTWSAAPSADYMVEAEAAQPSSGSNPDCTPSTQIATENMAGNALTSGSLTGLDATTLAFTGCQ